MYAANDADDDASTPDTKWYDPSCDDTVSARGSVLE